MPLRSGPGRYRAFNAIRSSRRWLGLAQDVAHAAALELENAIRLTVLKNLIGLSIVEWNRVDVEFDAHRPFDFRNGVEDERQSAEAQEIHLQQTDPLDLLHRPLGRDFVSCPFVERRVLG